MELQWPLIAFTTLLAWSAGLFGTQCLLAFNGEARKSQGIAWVCSAVLLVVGGIAVFFHLQHWERIFNGFGHLSSGITQELIAIVVLAIVAIVYLAVMRKSEDGASVPKWLACVGIAISVILLVVMAHSYMMASRPAWNSVMWIVYVFGNACVLGPATMALIMAARKDDFGPVKMPAIVGTVIGLVAAVAFAASLQACGGSFADVGYYFDPTSPTSALVDASANIAGQAPLLWGLAVVVGALAPVPIAAFAARKGESAWTVAGVLIVVLALIGAVVMRVVFYELGMSVFMFY